MSVGKGALAVSLTCASGVGGTFIYRAAVPGSWKDVLVRGGYEFLETLNEFEAVYKEHETELINKDANFKASLGTDANAAHSRLKTWCLSELQTTYTGEEEDRDRLVKLCTIDGIISVKARLTSNKKHSFIEDEATGEQDKKYKVVFAVYRYSEAFTTWLKGMVGGEAEFDSNSSVEENYKKLKDICVTELKRPYKEKADPDYYKNLSWWCQKLTYETLEELAKHRDTTWVTDEEGKNKGTKWTYTDSVKTEMKANSVIQGAQQGVSGAGGQQDELQDSDVQKWCKDNKSKPLYEDGYYQEKYKIFYSVCRKESS